MTVCSIGGPVKWAARRCRGVSAARSTALQGVSSAEAERERRRAGYKAGRERLEVLRHTHELAARDPPVGRF
jgi:hypothetical protein